jgi:hypothetical protein
VAVERRWRPAEAVGLDLVIEQRSPASHVAPKR